MSRSKINESKIDRYGRMRLVFIKEHRKDLYTELLFSGSLEDYLCELKAHDQMAWVGTMNAIKAQAEEVILNEIIRE